MPKCWREQRRIPKAMNYDSLIEREEGTVMSFSSRLRHAGIGVRLGAAFGTLALLLLACVAFGVLRLSSLNDSMQSLLEHEAHASVLSATVVSQTHETSEVLGRAAMADSVDVVQVNIKQADTLRSASQATKKSLAEALKGEAARAALKEVEAAEPAYRTAMDKVVAAIKGGDTGAARIALNEKSLLVAEAAYLSALDKLDAHQRDAMEVAKREAAAAYSAGRNLLFGVALVAVALAAMLGLWITRSLTRQLGAEPASAAALAKSVAAGDLSVRIELRPGDTTSLMASLKNMRDSLLKVVSGVRRNAESVATASAQIAQGNEELSSRTEQQASALQQAAATMDELGSTARNSADNARQANQLAQGASTVAVKGGEVVGQVVDTMKRINDSSRKIADIIGVIDGIAFQTNILALNAAVEAARAGEQGRGFAVVAGEVRNLARRSAEAAKEIKGLITASVERVEQGTSLVDQAGATMAEIVTAIKRVTDIMGEISAASSEQSAGVAQISQAVSQMDQATQQNAALVEESGAAAESLKQQAQLLVQSVAVFKLSQGESSQVAASMPAARRPTAERRGPNRAKNVVRPKFTAKTPRPAAAPVLAAPAKTGTDDWESF